MKVAANYLTWCVTLAVTLGASVTHAGTHPVSGSAVIPLVIGQADSERDRRRQAEQWLDQAREAMKNGKLDVAEYYVERAENLDVKVDPIFSRFKDTPEKVRTDLAQMRSQGPVRPTGEPNGAQAPPADPYRGTQTNSFPATSAPAGSVTPYPRTNADGGFGGAAPAETRAALGTPTESSPVPSANGGSFQPLGAGNASNQPVAAMQRNEFASGAGGSLSDTRGSSDAMLLDARRALAMGDLNAARQLTAKAKQLGVVYPLHADSPEKVDVLINQGMDFKSGRNSAQDPANFPRNFAQFLMDQAEGLVKYNDLELAERMARQAGDMPVNYRPFDRTPDKLIAQIASARQGQPAAAGDDGAMSRLPQLPAGANQSKAAAMQLVARARAALDRGDLAGAEQFARQAEALQVPDNAFAGNDTRPWEILLEVGKIRTRQGGVTRAGYDAQQAVANVQNINDNGAGGNYPVSQGIYNPSFDGTRNVAAQATQPTPASPQVQNGPGMASFQQGMRALEARDRETALRHFRDAWRFEGQLDPITRQQLQDKLNLLRTVNNAGGQEPSPLEEIDAQQRLLKQKLYREITAIQAESEQMKGSDPRAGLDHLEKLRDRISSAEVDPASKKQLLTLVDRSIDSMEQHISEFRSHIELDEQNDRVMEDIQLTAEQREQIQEKIAELVEQFNTLLDENRYAEAEVIAKQARELDSRSAVVQNLVWKSRFARRYHEQNTIDEAKEQGFYDTLTAVERSGIPFSDENPIRFLEPQRWEDLSNNRGTFLEQQRQRMTAEEVAISRSMKNKVDVKFTDRPLAEVMDILSELSGIPIVLDPQGLAAEGVTTDTPVTIRLNQQISLQSAMNLILEPLRLSYVIQNEVLRVTSEQTRDSNVNTQVYNVADLVIPIPNFIPGYNIGLPGAIQAAHNNLGYGANSFPTGSMPLTVASNQSAPPVANASVLAQMGAAGMVRSMSNQPSQPMGFGPGGLGGAALADFDTLIELITSTIAPDSWDEVGGAGAIEPFPTNLSLVISQTQDIHEQIADLLEQLRRLQDLQVTIEVRFITLNDNFFERIGIDFDFDIDDNVNVDMIRNAGISGGIGDDQGPSVAIGLDEMGPTVDLDIPFTQDSFGAAVPQFGGFDAATAANFGFAILSDIEVFFLLQAAHGDQRSNVLQAPKVTLFNGQTASVNDISQRPFVTSIIPVVGDFAAAQQPVIVVLSEGTSLSVQAVVSQDRRFVRLTLVPFFSRIGDVEEFTFEGRTTTDTGSIVTDPDTGEQIGRDDAIVTQEGTTVQLPTFVFTTVSTTVSVPDGGTVLLGGIKRLSEGRSERGVPMLAQLPYVNRLFKNVGIGRQAQSLMMMVTPRIIIQEEEERAQTGYSRGQ